MIAPRPPADHEAAPGAGGGGAYPHVWRHRKWPQTAAGWDDRDLRHGQRCRVFARGRNGNLGVEFEDGARVVGVRYCAVEAAR